MSLVIENPSVAVDPTTEDRGRRSGGRRFAGSLLTWPAMVSVSALGILLVGLSFRLSALGASADLYYVVFWAGMLGAVLPIGTRLAQRGTRRLDRFLAVLLLGAITAVPKYLRNPDQPLYHDEYAHWREVVDVLSTGHLLRPNSLIPIVEFFPGTSALTAAIDRLTGLSPWSSGQILVLAAHLLGLFGVFVLAEVHLRSARAGAVAALVYALNPSAMYFDTQYAYESVAIGLFLWVLALASLATKAQERRHRIGFTLAAIACSAGCVVTHHLTSLFLVVVLVVVSATAGFRRRRSARRERRGLVTPAGKEPQDVAPAGKEAQDLAPDHPGVWSMVLLGTVVLGGLWLIVAWPTISYLSPYFGGSVEQLASMASTKGGGGREILAASVQPLWERGLTALAPVCVGVICLLGIIRWRRARMVLPSMTMGLILFGLIYFPSVPFVLAPSGAEGARRSWGFTYVGISLIVAMVMLHRKSDGNNQSDANEQSDDDKMSAGTRWPWPRWRGLVGLIVLTVLLVGNVGGGLNDPYRFPGTFKWGSDTDSASDEARTVARVLAAQTGRVRVVSDAYTALQLVAYGGLDVAAPSTGFPAWNLVQTDDDPTPDLARMLTTSQYNYLVVDIRMGEEPAFNGSNFGPDDPLLGQATPMANLTRLDRVPWANRIVATEHLRVYRLDLARIAATVRTGS
ncbi:hypothetical protein ABIB25_003443 [Nakamurella sp. UYEF19]|uniref:hypothetical protein n=1 Tax=Nakamurella sp. UYEF19 TaxID=1756392 RepID=UPI003394097A